MRSMSKVPDTTKKLKDRVMLLFSMLYLIKLSISYVKNTSIFTLNHMKFMLQH